MSVAIEVESLSKRYRIGEYHAAYGTLREIAACTRAKRLTGREHDKPATEIWALRTSRSRSRRVRCSGIIGRNGAGKSTLLKILTRIVTPTSGRAEIRGRVGSLLEVGTGFNQELTGRENVYLNGAILGMKRREIERRFDEIVEFSGVERFIDTPVKRYSSGMYVRLAFAVAAHFEPEIMLVDEVLSVGDAEFQRRCLGRMEELGNAGRTVLFVSHALPAIAQLCDRAIWIDGGRARRRRQAAEVIAELPAPGAAAAPSASGRRSRRRATTSRGSSPSARCRTRGCRRASWTYAGRSASRSGSRCLREGKPLFPKIKVLDEEGAVAFNAMDTDERWLEPTPPGEYVSTAWIPANLLNEGTAIVEAAICSLDFPKLEHHAAVYEAVSLEVLDPGEGDSARGRFSGQWRGVVRPLLDWTVERWPARSERRLREVETPAPWAPPRRYDRKCDRVHVRVARGSRCRAPGICRTVRSIVRCGGRGRWVRDPNRGDRCDAGDPGSEIASFMLGSQTKVSVSHAFGTSGRRKLAESYLVFVDGDCIPRRISSPRFAKD